MQNNFNRLERLMSQVSLLSQFEEDTFTITIKKFDFRLFYQKVLEPYIILLGDQIQVKGMKTELDLMIEGDEERLIQVLENILNNAIDHTSSKYRLIEIGFEIFPKFIQIEVTDNGAGIAPENLERIFEQFVSIGTEFSVAGTGVGLYLSKMIIFSHGGAIKAQSEGLGKGSTFTIILPRKPVLQ